PVFSSAPPIQQPQAVTPAQKEAPPTTAVSADQAEPPSASQPIIVPVTVPAIPNNGLVPITFASNPPGAVVSFSRMGVCYTPCVTKLEPNRRYIVKMILAGYADWTSDINVEAGKPATVVAELQQQR
ncbi:MAG TPA: PEGA domain-containing protein, partial [Bryobacteraceae bacterium]|nr:PEGA domain-containing protein [Bryobacteraceae bacterium]